MSGWEPKQKHSNIYMLFQFTKQHGALPLQCGPCCPPTCSQKRCSCVRTSSSFRFGSARCRRSSMLDLKVLTTVRNTSVAGLGGLVSTMFCASSMRASATCFFSYEIQAYSRWIRSHLYAPCSFLYRLEEHIVLPYSFDVLITVLYF